MILIVTGGRDYEPNMGELSDLLCGVIDAWKVTEVVHGDARGLDSAAHAVVERSRPNVKITIFPYPSEHGKRGGPIRNSEMAQYAKGKPSLCVAFPGGAGTADMVKKAKSAGIAVLDCRESL